MENAILMASGMGTRMRPLTETMPKPLITVFDKPMIETIIEGLEKRGVSNIYVVVGYLGEKFYYLTGKYHNVNIIRNNDYSTINNISSVFAARDVLADADCFICEADLFVADPSIFEANLEASCYYGKMVKGYSSDWVFDQNENGIITRVGKGGNDCFNMTGISFFKQHDAKFLQQAIIKEYGIPGYENMFWDDVINKYIKDFHLTVHPVENDQIVEIDTVKELYEVRERFCKRGKNER